MLKIFLRVILILCSAALGLIIGEALNSVFGGVDFNFSPIMAIVFSITAVCVIICEQK